MRGAAGGITTTATAKDFSGYEPVEVAGGRVSAYPPIAFYQILNYQVSAR